MGSDGKGNGTFVRTIPMHPPPSDLTQLTNDNGGKFPFDEMVDDDRRPQEYTVA